MKLSDVFKISLHKNKSKQTDMFGAKWKDFTTFFSERMQDSPNRTWQHILAVKATHDRHSIHPGSAQ